ncbi:hypothetical protein [Vagococcus fluvialis]|uniref:hypothetical protein n=1 Tax=Vagococcus fluvialis TaxID=2738 RepID=UPI003B223F47
MTYYKTLSEMNQGIKEATKEIDGNISDLEVYKKEIEQKIATHEAQKGAFSVEATKQKAELRNELQVALETIEEAKENRKQIIKDLGISKQSVDYLKSSAANVYGEELVKKYGKKMEECFKALRELDEGWYNEIMSYSNAQEAEQRKIENSHKGLWEASGISLSVDSRLRNDSLIFKNKAKDEAFKDWRF